MWCTFARYSGSVDVNTFLAFRQRHPADRVISRTTWAQTGVPLSRRTWVKSAIRQVVRLMPIAEGGSWRREKTACRVASLSARCAPIRLSFVNKASTPPAVNTRTYFLTETGLMEREAAGSKPRSPREWQTAFSNPPTLRVLPPGGRDQIASREGPNPSSSAGESVSPELPWLQAQRPVAHLEDLARNIRSALRT
jgi:hypothetical protein